MRLERTAQVWGICGNLGGGKTLTAVELAVQSMISGYFVCTNIDLHLDLMAETYGDYLRSLYLRVDLEKDDPSSWPCGDPRGSGGRRRVLVILDEVAEWFDQFSGTSKQVRGFLSWLRHSSKRSQDVVLVVQRKEYLAKSLRILVSRWIWVEDLAVWRIPHFRIKVPFMGGFIMRYVADRVGNRIQPIEYSRKEVWGQYYDTGQQLLTSSLGTPYDLPEIRPKPPIIVWPWVVVLLWVVSRL